MFKYKDHRATLADSMKTVREFSAKEELLLYLQESLRPLGVHLSSEDVTIEPYGYDGRIDWDLHIVCIKDYGVAGFTDALI